MSVCKHQENKSGVQAAYILLEKKRQRNKMISTINLIININTPEFLSFFSYSLQIKVPATTDYELQLF